MAHDSLGPKNQPVFSAAGPPADAADLTEVGEYASVVGNRKADLSTVRTSLSGADVWPGLEFYETDTDITYRYRSTGWYRAGRGTWRGTRSQLIGNASLSSLGAFSTDSGDSSATDFVSSSASGITLIEGEYDITMTYVIGAASTGRCFLQMVVNNQIVRCPVGAGEDTFSGSANFWVGSGGATIQLSVFQTTGGNQTGTVSVLISKRS
jgi:hypothetical protein